MPRDLITPLGFGSLKHQVLVVEIEGWQGVGRKTGPGERQGEAECESDKEHNNLLIFWYSEKTTIVRRDNRWKNSQKTRTQAQNKCNLSPNIPQFAGCPLLPAIYIKRTPPFCLHIFQYGYLVKARGDLQRIIGLMGVLFKLCDHVPSTAFTHSHVLINSFPPYKKPLIQMLFRTPILQRGNGSSALCRG